MLKLKIMTAALAVASLILLLTGSTYFTAALSVICTATTLLPAGYLMWRWLLDEKPSWFHSITWAALSGLIAARALKDIGIIDIPLGTVMSSGIGKLRIVYEYPTDFSRGSRAVVAHARQQ